MCGRVVIDRNLEEIAEIFGAAIHVNPTVRTGPRYNVAPTMPIRAVRLDAKGNRELVAVY